MKGLVRAVVPDKTNIPHRSMVTAFFAVFGGAILLIWFCTQHMAALLPSAAVVGAAAFLQTLAGFLHPVRIEFKDDKLSVFYRNRFRYYNLEDLESVRPVKGWRRTLLLTSRPVYELKFKNGKSLVLPDEAKKPGELGRALSKWAPDLLKSQSLIFPPFTSKGAANNVVIVSILAVTLILLLFGLFSTQWKFGPLSNLPFFFVIFFRTKGTQTVELLSSHLRIHQTSRAVQLDYSQVEVIDITNDDHGVETMVVRGREDAITISRTSREPDYPAIRDFLLKNCHNARLTGLDDPDDLVLCSLTRVQEDEGENLPNLNARPPIQTQTQQPNPTVTT